MRKESLAFLKELLSTPSPTGREEKIQAVVKDYVKPYVNKVYKDVHGNQFAVKNPNAKLRVMLAGHVDEIALMINYIDSNGFISFVPVGGVDPSVLDGQRIIVHGEKGPVPGVIGRTAIHLTEPEDRGKALKMHQLWADIGVPDRKSAEKLVAVGDTITIDADFLPLHGDNVVARALDDRIGAFVIVETMRLLAKRKVNVAVYCVTTVQEEIGLRGATTSAYGIEPHAGIAVDVGHALDYPSCEHKKHGSTKLGDGPILHRGPNINPVIEKQLLQTARKKKIPHQIIAAPRGTGTDANAIQISRAGVAAGLVAIPNRYMHSPVEMVNLRDVENASILIAEWIAGLSENTSFIP